MPALQISSKMAITFLRLCNLEEVVDPDPLVLYKLQSEPNLYFTFFLKHTEVFSCRLTKLEVCCQSNLLSVELSSH